MDDPDLPLGFVVSSVGQQVQAGFAAVLAGHGATPRQFAVLWALSRTEASQRELSDRLGIPPSRVVALLDELEATGDVVRRPHPTDRRARTVVLTDAGRTRLGRLWRAAGDYERAVVAGLDDDDRRRLRTLLSGLRPPGGAAGGLRAW